MTKPLVILEKVQKHFGDFIAVKEINLEINEGEFLAIMGPSGWKDYNTANAFRS